MSFDELFDSCFRTLPLIKLPATQSKELEANCVKLEDVACSSQYLAFLLVSNTKGALIADSLEKMVKTRNESDKQKPQNSPARLRRFFSLKKKKKKRDLGETVTVSVIVLDTDLRAEDTSLLKPGWYSCRPPTPTVKSRLLRALGFEFPPSIILVDSLSRSVITTEGRRLLAEDPNGTSFPWWPQPSSDLLKGTIVRCVEGKQETSQYADIKATHIALFFGAFWCPPCREWLKQLGPVYKSLKENGISFEILFCSSDRSQEFFNQFLSQMPWAAFAYDTSKTLALTRLFNISGIPAMLIIDSKGHVVSRHGRSTLLADPRGTQFPWGPRPMYELDEHSVCRLRDEPSLILFTEGSPEDIEFSVSILDNISKKLFFEKQKLEEKRAEEREKRFEERENSENGNSLSKSASSEECSSTSSADIVASAAPPDPLQILYTGEDPICDHILEKILGLEDAELPLICIVDGLAGQFAICEKPDVSEEVLEEFVSNYRNDRLDWIPLPSANETGRSVGGTPKDIIEKALIANSSPSHNAHPGEDAKVI